MGQPFASRCRGLVVHALGVQPTLTMELGIPVSAVSSHWWPQRDHWSPASAIGPTSPTSIHSLQDYSGPNSYFLLHSFTHQIEPGPLYSNTPIRAWSVTGRESCGGREINIPYTISLVQRVYRLFPTAGGSSSHLRCATHTHTGTGIPVSAVSLQSGIKGKSWCERGERSIRTVCTCSLKPLSNMGNLPLYCQE